MGKPYQLDCSVAAHVTVERCVWHGPGGRQLSAGQGPSLFPGLSAALAPTSCSLAIDRLDSQHLGTWACRSASSPTPSYFLLG